MRNIIQYIIKLHMIRLSLDRYLYKGGQTNPAINYPIRLDDK